MSTYVTVLCAGPYHEVRETHDGIDLGLYVRDSMKQYLDPDDLFLITRQGFDFFHEQFGVRYPLPKYDQVWVPDFNAGAMENFGCVVHGEEYYIFRSQVTDYEFENRANTILHEMAHMWFGDLVTMRWWDDLWLNESFAEWASHWCNAQATRFADAWTTFLSIRKNWGYRQDQLSSTHPVYAEITDVEAVEVNFDGITYAKGASVIKQLVAYVGIDAFLAGLRSYFAAHAWGNATFGDLLSALEEASGRPLGGFARQWLETAQVNTLRPIVEIGPDGTYASVTVAQEAAEGYPTLRTHRMLVGLYDRDGDRLVRRDRVDVVISGERTRLDQLTGVRAADVLLLNDDDLTYAKLRLDERSMSTVVDHLSGLDSSLARALCWAAAWDMARDAELAARDYVRLVCVALPTETDINLVTATLRQAQAALHQYADPSWHETGARLLADTSRLALAAAEPGSGFQLAWARAYAGAARDHADLDVLRGWLAGDGVPKALSIDTELRWTLLHALVAEGAAGPDEIEAEFDRDRTASGERAVAQARALIPTAEGKAEVWRQLDRPGEAGQLATALAAARLPPPVAARADRALRGGLLRRARPDLGDPRQRAGPGVRGLRLPGSVRGAAHGRPHRSLDGGRRPPGPAAPAGCRGARRGDPLAEGAGQGRNRRLRPGLDVRGGTLRDRKYCVECPSERSGGLGQGRPACAASWAIPATTPPPRSPPANAADIDSAASFASRSRMRRRATIPVTISSTR